MSRNLPVQEAKSRSSELLDATLAQGPQIVTRRGIETAVLLPIEQWRRPERLTSPNLKEWLLAPEARTDDLTPPPTPPFSQLKNRPSHHHPAAPATSPGHTSPRTPDTS